MQHTMTRDASCALRCPDIRSVRSSQAGRLNRNSVYTSTISGRQGGSMQAQRVWRTDIHMQPA